MEIGPAYIDVVVVRWQEDTGRDPILDGDGRTLKTTREREPAEEFDAVAGSGPAQHETVDRMGRRSRAASRRLGASQQAPAGSSSVRLSGVLSVIGLRQQPDHNRKTPVTTSARTCTTPADTIKAGDVQSGLHLMRRVELR